MDDAIADAFPGARVDVVSAGAFFEIEMQQHGLRPLKASKLSSGKLRYLLLVAALLSPRPPMALP
jgi:predicted ATPase